MPFTANRVFTDREEYIRRSRYPEVVRQIERRSAGTRLERIGAGDLMGHVYLHNARFQEAAELFT